jgi:hypothetical protein
LRDERKLLEKRVEKKSLLNNILATAKSKLCVNEFILKNGVREK